METAYDDRGMANNINTTPHMGLTRVSLLEPPGAVEADFS
jgi:hypothetical protein